MRSIASSVSYRCPEPVLFVVGGHPFENIQFQGCVFRRGVNDVFGNEMVLPQFPGYHPPELSETLFR